MIRMNKFIGNSWSFQLNKRRKKMLSSNLNQNYAIDSIYWFTWIQPWMWLLWEVVDSPYYICMSPSGPHSNDIFSIFSKSFAQSIWELMPLKNFIHFEHSTPQSYNIHQELFKTMSSSSICILNDQKSFGNICFVPLNFHNYWKMVFFLFTMQIHHLVTLIESISMILI